MSDVIRIELGTSIPDAQLMVQEAKASGLRVELLRNEYPETGGFFSLGGCALLVNSDDEADLRALLATFGY